jgi:hypothetical protein
VQWDITVGIVVRGGELYVTPYLDDPSPELTPLTGPLQVVWGSPLVLAGRLPVGAVDVRAVEEGWSLVEARAGAWLACAERVKPDPLRELEFVDADGHGVAIPAPDPDTQEALDSYQQGLAGEPEPLPALNDEGRAYASTIARILADDVARHGPAGPLRRVVIRWFWNGDPEYLTLHVLGAHDEQPPPEDAWYPLEWADEEREFERTDRVLAHPAVVDAAAVLAATFPHDRDGEVDGYAHVTAVHELVAQLPAALSAAGVELGDRFAVSAAHFEGWGARGVLEATARPELLKALADSGELPEE